MRTTKKDRHETTIIVEPKHLYLDEIPDNTPKKRKPDGTEAFIVSEPANIGKIDPENKLIFEEAFTQNSASQNLPGKSRKNEIKKEMDTHGEKGKGIKSFKQHIRPGENRHAPSLIVQTLQFFRKVIQSIPGLGINTGIKGKLDNLIQKMIKK